MSDKINLQTIENIIFDLGGVIFNINYDLTLKAFKNEGFKDFNKLFNQLNQANFFNLFEKAEISTEKFLNTIRKLSGKELSDSAIINAWNAMLLCLPKHKLQLLKKLKSNYKLFLLSNTNALHLKKLNEIIQKDNGIESLDPYFEKTYYSFRIGKRKPEIDAYLHVIQENDLIIEKTLFIDDNMENINSAKKIGLKVFHEKSGKDWETFFRVNSI